MGLGPSHGGHVWKRCTTRDVDRLVLDAFLRRTQIVRSALIPLETNTVRPCVDDGWAVEWVDGAYCPEKCLLPVG